MKKVNVSPKLNLQKNVVSKLTANKASGGWHGGGGNTVFCITNGALNSCPPPGHYCL